MCEIAVVDPEQANLTIIQQIAAKFHEEQGDGLGVLAVKESPDGFEYDTYKSIHPHWQTLYAFLKRNVEDTWRFVVHGRASTCGDVNRESSHPIRVDCDKCQYDYVVHNGSVRNHRNIRGGLSSAGHDFNTKVDSEVLAHKVSELPETVEDHDRSTYSFRGNLNYLLFSEDGILIRVSSKYHLTDDVTMTCSLRSFDDYEDLGFERGNDTEWMLIEPGEDGPEIETKERSRTSRPSSNVYHAGNAWGGYQGASETQSNPDTYTKEYTDHCDEYEHIVAIKVAPGIMEIIDKKDGQSKYVYRDANPRLYYWYAPDEPQASIEYLEEKAEQNPYKPGQTQLGDFGDSADDGGADEAFPEEEEVKQSAAATIIEEEGNVSNEEALEIAADVYEQLQTNEDAIQGTIGE